MCDNNSIAGYNSSAFSDTNIGQALIKICNQLQSQQAAAQLQNNQSLGNAFSLLSTIYGLDVNMDFFFMFILAALVFCERAPCFERFVFDHANARQ